MEIKLKAVRLENWNITNAQVNYSKSSKTTKNPNRYKFNAKTIFSSFQRSPKTRKRSKLMSRKKVDKQLEIECILSQSSPIK